MPARLMIFCSRALLALYSSATCLDRKHMRTAGQLSIAPPRLHSLHALSARCAWRILKTPSARTANHKSGESQQHRIIERYRRMTSKAEPPHSCSLQSQQRRQGCHLDDSANHACVYMVPRLQGHFNIWQCCRQGKDDCSRPAMRARQLSYRLQQDHHGDGCAARTGNGF